MRRFRLLFSLLITLIPAFATATSLSEADIAKLEQYVKKVERQFADSMAKRDFDAFSKLVDEDAVFEGGEQPLRGKAAVLAAWKPYFEKPEAPFSWEPETVFVIASGDIALSTGPVKNSKGEVVAYFHSTWRKNANGDWRIILDKGQKYCASDDAKH